MIVLWELKEKPAFSSFIWDVEETQSWGLNLLAGKSQSHSDHFHLPKHLSKMCLHL